MDKKDIISLTIIFIISFNIWTLPVQDNNIPFGEGDAAHQYAKSDYMAYSDKARINNPFFLYKTWYQDHPDDPSKPSHAPIYFLSHAIPQILGGDRFTPKNIFLALCANFFVIISVYFLIRQLYGFWYASLSGFMLIFPLRNFMSYAWGQRPILLAMGFIPLILYSYYKYSLSMKNRKEEKRYLIMMAILIASVVFIHIVATWAIFLILSVFTLLFYLKNKVIPFNLKTVGITILVFLVITLPFIGVYLKQSHAREESSFKLNVVSNLLNWYGAGGKENNFMWSYSGVHGGFWSLPFLLLGVVYLLIKRRDKDIVILSWLIGLYFALHFALGLFEGRVDRLFKGESHLFYPLIVIGLLSIPHFFKLSKIKKQIMNISLIVAFVGLVLFFNAPQVYKTSSGLYSGVQRITTEQLEATEWIDNNLPEEAIIFHQPSRDGFPPNLNGWIYQKMRWKQILSHRAMHDIVDGYNSTHVMIDYSDFKAVGAQDIINILKEFEENLQNVSLLYDKNSIKVYEIG